MHLDLTDILKVRAGMGQNNEQIGIAAVDMLVGQLHRNEYGARSFQNCMIIAAPACTAVRQPAGAKAKKSTRKKAV